MSVLKKILAIILIIQYSNASPCFDGNLYDYDYETDEYYSSGCNSDNVPECPEDQSLISSNDLIALINFAAKRSHVVEDIIASYNDRFVALNNKYIEQLDGFQKRAEDKQGHLKHILESLEDLHQKLEPVGQSIAADLNKIDASEERVSDVNNNLEKTLRKFELLQELCELKGINQNPVNDLERNRVVFKSSHVDMNFKPICGNIEVIYAIAMQQLYDFRDDMISALLDDFEYGELENALNASVISYNDNLKEGALKQHDKLMYDILILQDGYFHLNQYFNNFNISMKLDTIENNMKKVEIMLVDMETNLEKYEQKCSNSPMPSRIQRGTVGRQVIADYYDSQPHIDFPGSDVVDDVISIKIEELAQIIVNHASNVMKPLVDRLQNPEPYLQKLEPKEEDIENVKKAIEKMNDLKKIIPESSFKKLQDLYDQSEQVLQEAEKAMKDIEEKIQ